MRYVKIIAASLAVVIAFGVTALWSLQGNDEVNAICLDLASQERAGRTGVVAMGEFLAHNENFAYIGDTVSFELAVAYNPDKVNVIDDELSQFNVAPFTLLDKGSVHTAVFDGCIVKRLRFVMRVIGVQIGERNAFWYRSLDNIVRRPSIPYEFDGERKYSSITYDELFVVSLTGGEIIHPRDIPKVALEEPQNEGNKLFAVVLVVLGVWLILLSATISYVWRRNSKRKKMLALEEVPDSILVRYPGFEMDGSPSERLASVYFSLRKNLLKLSNKALIVFDENVKDEELEHVLRDIRSTLEANEARSKGGEV